LRRHGGEPGRSCAAHELQQHGLGLIVGMMRERDDIRIGRRERRVAFGARRCLEAFAARPLDAHAMHRKRHVPRGALGRAKRRPRIGMCRESVMDVRGGECDAELRREAGERIEERHRVPSARQRDDDAKRRGITPRRCCRSIASNRCCRSEGLAHGDEHRFNGCGGVRHGNRERPSEISCGGETCPPASRLDQPAGISLYLP
jgi:hypothetical protein